MAGEEWHMTRKLSFLLGDVQDVAGRKQLAAVTLSGQTPPSIRRHPTATVQYVCSHTTRARGLSSAETNNWHQASSANFEQRPPPHMCVRPTELVSHQSSVLPLAGHSWP